MATHVSAGTAEISSIEGLNGVSNRESHSVRAWPKRFGAKFPQGRAIAPLPGCDITITIGALLAMLMMR